MRTLARSPRPRYSAPPHHPIEVDDPPRDQPLARAPRGVHSASALLLRGGPQKTGPRVGSRLSTDDATDQDPPKCVQDPSAALRLLGTLIRARGGGQNHIDLGSDACMSASFLSSTSAPSAHESPGARIERTRLQARSKCERVQRGSFWCSGRGGARGGGGPFSNWLLGRLFENRGHGLGLVTHV